MRNFILGSDWYDDCDDAVAMRVLSYFVKQNRARLLGVAINACMEYSVASLKGFLLQEGLSNVPIGLDFSGTDFGGILTYQKRLALNFAPQTRNTDAVDALSLYRKLLAESTEKVEIIEIGYLPVLAALLQSGPDAFSEKTGLELVCEKVKKFWVMAGRWDFQGGMENNFCRNVRSRIAAEAFCRMCPVPVTFLGFEVGENVITGGNLKKTDHLYHVLQDHGSGSGRHSWDPMLVLMAMIGDEERAGYDKVTGIARVDAVTGKNFFSEEVNGKHSYVKKRYENAYYEKEINGLLQ